MSVSPGMGLPSNVHECEKSAISKSVVILISFPSHIVTSSPKSISVVKDPVSINTAESKFGFL